MAETKKKLKKKIKPGVVPVNGKKKHSLGFKLGITFAIVLLVLVGLVVGGFYYLSHRYYNMLDYVGKDSTDVTMAPGETLEPEEGDNDPDMTDSPSDEVTAIESMLDQIMQEYEKEHGTGSAQQPSVSEKDYMDEPELDETTVDVTDSSNLDDSKSEGEKATSAATSAGGNSATAAGGNTSSGGTPKPPTTKPNTNVNSGSGLSNGGVGNADMPSVGVDPNVTNILLIGIDSRANNNSGRSDSMIIMSINKATKRIILTSILRDCYVAIPGRGNNRLNAAHAYGGAGLLMQTIEANFGIHIDYFARVNFYSFIDIIDAIGGVNINLTAAEIKEIGMNAEPGEHLLNGAKALSYARIRHIGTDYARTQRQRTVILSVVNKMRGMSFGELDNFLGKALPRIATDLTQDVLNSLVLSVPALLKYDVVQHRIPVDGTGTGVRIDGKSVISVDLIANRNLLNQIVYGR